MTFDLPSLGWDAYFADAYAAYDRPTRRPGRVMRVDRGICTVLAESGATQTSLAGSVLAAAIAVALAGMTGIRQLRKLLSTGSFGAVRLDGSQYTDAAEPEGTDSTSFVQLDRSEYTEIR